MNAADVDGIASTFTVSVVDGAVDLAPIEPPQLLVKVVLVPIEIFPGECGACEEDVAYGLMDAVGAGSDCNRAHGKIYRRAAQNEIEWFPAEDVITVYVPESELAKFERRRGEEYGD